MEPGLTDGERIFINKFTYKLNLGDVRRGDTVVFWYPRDTSKSYIKRVVGLPGDRIRILRGQVYVNGAPLGDGEHVAQRYRDMSTWAGWTGRDRPDWRIFRAGRPPELIQRQPGLGLCTPLEHLRQGRLCLLAAG